MFECDSNDESEVLMTRVIDALGANGGDNCSGHMDNVGHDVEETKLIELNNLIQQIKLTTATPAGVDVTSESMENEHKQQMEDSPNLAWQEFPNHNQVVEQFEHGNSDVNDKDLEDKKVCAMTAELSKIKEENALMKVEVVDILSTKEKLEKELSDKNEQLSHIKHNENELKERLILLETERNKNVLKEKTYLESDLKKLIEEKLDVEENKMYEIDQLKKENQAKTDEAEALITQNAVEIEHLKMEMDEIKADNEALRSTMAEKEERDKKVLTNAKVKIQKVELENRELLKQLDAIKADFEAQINFLKDAKSKEEEAKNENAVEIENLKMEMDEIKAGNETLRSAMAEKKERAIQVLTNAKVKIQKVELENRELQKQLDATKSAFEAQINFLKDAKSKEEAKNDLLEEKKMLEEELQQWIKDSHLKCEQISKLENNNLQLKKLGRKTKKEHEVERKVFKLEKEMKMLKRNSEDKNEQLMKLGKNFMEVLNLAENENASNKKQHTESDHQRPSSMSNEHQSQNPCELFVHGIDEHIQNHEMVAEFGKYGTVTDAFNTGRGYAFITYSSPADAQDCLTNANGKRAFGKTIQIKGRIRNLQKKASGESFKGNLNSKADRGRQETQRMAQGTGDYGSKVGEMDSTSTYSSFSGTARLGGGSDTIRLGEDWYELNGRYLPKKVGGEGFKGNLYSKTGKSGEEKQRMAHGTGYYGSRKFEAGDLTGLGGGSGTTIRFKAPIGSDMMLKDGIQTQVTVQLQTITCMKEYEKKSLEELRWEDYLSGRKRGSTTEAQLRKGGGVGFMPFVPARL